MVLRGLIRSRAFAATTTAIIALAVALAATVHAVVDGVLFKPLPYERPDRLFELMGRDSSGTSASLAPSDVEYLRAADPRIVITATGGSRGLRPVDRPETVVWWASVEPNLFDVLGRRPLMGAFSPDDFARAPAVDQPAPAIVSHAFWRDRLGSDPSAMGRFFDLVGMRLIVRGVLPADFVFPQAFGRTRPDILVPLVHGRDAQADRWARSLFGVARVDPSMPVAEAQSRLDAALGSRAGEYTPRERHEPGPYTAVALRPLERRLGQNERPFFGAAFAGAALLVLLACVNVAGLLGARAHDRHRELSLRIAVGASRRDLARLLLSEAAVIALAGAALGVLLARPLLRVTLRMLPESLNLLKTAAIDVRVIVFAVGAAVVTMTVVSALTLTGAVRTAVAGGIGAATATPRVRTWKRAAVLAAESAIGIALVLAGTLMLASFVTLRAVDPGLDRRLGVVDVITPWATARADRSALYEKVSARIQQTPGVARVATVHVPLLESMSGGSGFSIPPGGTSVFSNDTPVSGAFFDLAGLRLLDGRFPTAGEFDAGRPVAVVSERVARSYWPNQGAVGQVLIGDGGKRRVTVVGVVEEARFGSQSEGGQGEIYLPVSYARTTWTVFLFSTSGDTDRLAREVATAINRDVSGAVVRRAESLETALAKSVSLYTFRTTLFAVAAAAALLMVAVGVAGLVGMGIARRLRELGIRAALGAARTRIVVMIIGEYLRPVAAGAALGLIASWWLSRLFSRLVFVYETDAHDARVWLAAIATLMLVTAGAAWIAARRASRLDPAAVLRQE